MTRHPDFSATAIYDGRDYLGAIASPAPRIFKAIDADGRPLGTFRTLIEARDAVLKTHRTDAEQAR